VLVLDGSYGEGGGQLLRSALSLSLILKLPFKMIKIRAGRPKPGLQPQHYCCVEACKKLSQARVEGDYLYSQELFFSPEHSPENKVYTFDIGTAGSTTLLFQTLFYPLALSQGGTLVLKGGTHVPYSPPYHYIERVYLPVVENFGFQGTITLERAGFYPKGGGEIIAHIKATRKLKIPQFPEKFFPQRIHILSLISEDLPSHILERQAKAAQAILKAEGYEGEIFLEKVKASSPGTMLLVYGEGGPLRAGFSILGRKGVPAEEVGKRAAQEFLHFLKTQAQVEEHLGDQLLLPASLSLLSSEEKTFSYTVSKLTRHLLTQAWLIPQFLKEISIKVEGKEGEKGGVILERR